MTTSPPAIIDALLGLFMRPMVTVALPTTKMIAPATAQNEAKYPLCGLLETPGGSVIAPSGLLLPLAR